MVLRGRVEHFAWEHPNDAALNGCQRAIFRLRVDEGTYDDFFNSPVGYRAQFALSTSAGCDANVELLDALEPVLIRFARLEVQATDRIVWSLRGPDAKIWIDESEVEGQLGQTVEQILYEPWRLKSLDGAGLLAPLGQRLEVKGAWVDAFGQFRPNPKKAQRAEEIHSVGFS